MAATAEALVDSECGGGGGGGGLTTREALSRLHDDIAAALQHHTKEEAARQRGCWGSRAVLYEALHHHCQLSLFHWSSALALLLAAAALLAAHAASAHERSHRSRHEDILITSTVLSTRSHTPKYLENMGLL